MRAAALVSVLFRYRLIKVTRLNDRQRSWPLMLINRPAPPSPALSLEIPRASTPIRLILPASAAHVDGRRLSLFC